MTPTIIELITHGLESAYQAGVNPEDLWVGPDEDLALTAIANEWPSWGGNLSTMVGRKFGGLLVRRMDASGVAIR